MRPFLHDKRIMKRWMPSIPPTRIDQCVGDANSRGVCFDLPGRYSDDIDPAPCALLLTRLGVAKTLPAGHFSTIEVADQINAMVERFLAVGLERESMR
jgi:hypothetical protein